MHDEVTDKSYWVHVTKDSVESTGRGAKILVPATSTVDMDHAGELLEIATNGRISSQWEGSVWGGVEVLAADRFRYALLTPRLVAPHPNLKVSELLPDQAVALLIKMRLENLTPRAETGITSTTEDEPAPDLEQCRKSVDWGWRFYATLYDNLLGDADPDSLRTILDEAGTPYERAAAAVFACALLVEEANPRAGLEVVEGALACDDYVYIDQAWLTLHRARCLAELGDLENARLCAIEVQKLRAVAVDDPTAMAITGSGADLIFRLNPWDSDIGEVIKGRDTLASWWRAQEVAAGLQVQFDAHFQRWVGSAKESEFDQTFLRLRSGALLAGMAADHSSWRQSHKLLAQHILTSNSSHENVAESLSALRHAGEDKLVKDTTRHLLRVGPAAAVRIAASSVKLDQGTRTSLHADLQLISSSADVLDSEWADTHVRWILSNLSDLDVLTARLQPNFPLEYVLLSTLSDLVTVVSESVLREVVDHVKALPQQSDIGSSHEWGSVITSIPITAWTSDDRRVLGARTGDSHEIVGAFDRVLADGDPVHRERIQESLRKGEVHALDAFGDVRDLDDVAVVALTGALSSGIYRQIDGLKKGQTSIGGMDFASTLILLNAWHPKFAVWAPICDLLTTSSPFRAHLKGPLRGLQRHGVKVPVDVVDTIVGPLHDLMVTSPSVHPFFRNEDVRAASATALAAVRPSAISDTELWDLMHGNADQRAAAIEVVARKESVSRNDTFVAMSRDSDSWVRAVIANQVARTTPDAGDPDRLNLMRHLLANEGTLVARMVAVAIKTSPPDSETDKVADMLRNHVSAGVRQSIAEYDAKRVS